MIRKALMVKEILLSKHEPFFHTNQRYFAIPTWVSYSKWSADIWSELNVSSLVGSVVCVKTVINNVT